MADKCDICGETDPINFEHCEHCGKCCCDDCIDWCCDEYDYDCGANVCVNCQDNNERDNDGQD